MRSCERTTEAKVVGIARGRAWRTLAGRGAGGRELGAIAFAIGPLVGPAGLFTALAAAITTLGALNWDWLKGVFGSSTAWRRLNLAPRRCATRRPPWTWWWSRIAGRSWQAELQRCAASSGRRQ